MTYRKKHKRLIVTIKVITIFYVLLFSVSILSSNTSAYYNGIATVNQVIRSASDWWDGSELVFANSEEQIIESCLPADIAVEVKNNGLSMLHTAKYEIYYVEADEHLENDGEKIAESVIEPIEASSSAMLTYKADKAGVYIFKIEQNLGDDETQEAWSEVVKVHCDQNSEEESGQEQDKVDSDENQEEVTKREKEDKSTEQSTEKEDTNKSSKQESEEDSEGETDPSAPSNEVDDKGKETNSTIDSNKKESDTQIDEIEEEGEQNDT